MTFSVIIPALNEELVIERCLDSIVRLNYPAQHIEVIVVDNGSSDRTREIAESYSSLLDIKVLARPGITIAALRNAGAAVSSGDYLAFLDADVLVATDWLFNAEKILISSEMQLIGGFYRVPNNSSWVARSWFARNTEEVRRNPSYLPSGNLIVSRSDFFRIGGFDETLKTSEDCDFSFRARNRGLSIAQYDSISAVHLGSPQSLRSFFRREVWHGTSVFQVFLRNVSTFQNFRPVFFATYTLLCFVLIMLSSLLAFYGRPVPMFVSVGLLLLGPAVLGVAAARRGAWQRWPAFFMLFLVYGCARALSLILLMAGKRIRRATARDDLAELSVVDTARAADNQRGDGFVREDPTCFEPKAPHSET